MMLILHFASKPMPEDKLFRITKHSLKLIIIVIHRQWHIKRRYNL